MTVPKPILIDFTNNFFSIIEIECNILKIHYYFKLLIKNILKINKEI
jgi:hypothetical protein